MPTRNVYLTESLDRGIEKRLKSGQYENASEVFRAALRALEREEKEYKAKIDRINRELDAGEASGLFAGDPFEHVRRKLGIARGKRRG
jgi:putative addiction module CopG family antidote